MWSLTRSPCPLRYVGNTVLTVAGMVCVCGAHLGPLASECNRAYGSSKRGLAFRVFGECGASGTSRSLCRTESC